MSDNKVVCGNKCGKAWVPSFYDDCYFVNKVPMCESCAIRYFFKTRDLEPINDKHLEKVCQPGTEKACAFLGVASGFVCTKFTALEDILREEVEKGSMMALGDNCSGPPTFVVSK